MAILLAALVAVLLLQNATTPLWPISLQCTVSTLFTGRFSKSVVSMLWQHYLPTVAVGCGGTVHTPLWRSLRSQLRQFWEKSGTLYNHLWQSWLKPIALALSALYGNFIGSQKIEAGKNSLRRFQQKLMLIYSAAVILVQAKKATICRILQHF